MQGFRKFLQGPGGKILLALIIVPFVITAFYGYFTGGNSGDVVARVDDTPIYRSVVEDRVRVTRANMMRQSPNLDPRLLESIVTAPMVLQGMVNNLVILSAAKSSGMQISDEQAGSLLMQMEDFQINGRFDMALFERTVRAYGHTPSTFLVAIKDEVLANQIRAGYEDTEFALPYELADLRRLGEQQRDARYVQLTLSELAASVEISDEQVKAYYDSHLGDFMRPDEYQLEYIELSRAAFADQVDVSEQALRDEFDARQRVAQQQGGAFEERRQVAHMLFRITAERDEAAAIAEAEKVRAELSAGSADFATLAKVHSEDIATRNNGGRLGLLTREALGGELAQVTFALEKGEVSQPVRSDDGIHLLTVTDIRVPRQPTFEEQRQALLEELRESRQEELLADAVPRLEEMAFEHPDLMVPAETLGLSLKTSPFFTLSQPQGIAAEHDVRAELNERSVLSGQQNSRLIELSDSRFVVVRVADHRPETQMELAEVQDDIRARLQRDAAAEQLAQQEDRARALLSEGADLAAIADAWQHPVESLEGVERGGDSRNNAVAERLFRMARPQEGDTMTEVFRLDNGDLAAVMLTAVRDGQVDGLDDQQQAEALLRLAELEGGNTFRRVMTWMRETGDVKLYLDRLTSAAEGEVE